MSERIFDNSKVTTDDSGYEVGMNAQEGYFDNLSAAVTNKKSVLEQLVANNDKLTTTNKELVDIVKKFQQK